MNAENLKITYELDSSVDLITEEAKRAFALQVEEIMLRTKREIETALSEMKGLEQRQIAEDRAKDIARRMAAYEANGLSSERAWELVKQDAMMIPYRWGCA